MGSNNVTSAKIVIAVTSLVFVSACGHKSVQSEGPALEIPAVSGTSSATSYDPYADYSDDSVEPAPAVKKKSARKKAFSFKRKKAGKRMLTKHKQGKATHTAMNVIPPPVSAEQKPFDAIDPSLLPLSIGSIETPPPPPPSSHPPIYEGVKSETGKIVGIGAIVLIALAGTSFAIRRRRNRQQLIFN